MILTVLSISLVTYCCVLLFSAFVLLTKKSAYDKLKSTSSAASIIVAVRNEEKSVLECIRSLQNQDHPATQIVISNDDSSDKTESIVESLIEREHLDQNELHLISRGDQDLPFGKSGALHNGILNSSNPIIITTDADCTPPRDWVGNMAAMAQHESVGVVAGLTCIRGERLLDKIQNYDWVYLQSASSALSLLGFPVTAMGNNMAFSRENYESTGGYPKLPSSVTEDFVLFMSIPRFSGKAAMVIPDSEFKNFTKGAESWKRIFSQRKRWALGGFAGGPLVWALYLMTSLAHWSALALLVLSPLNGLVLLATKLICDLLMTIAGFRRLKEKSPGIISFFVFEAWLFFYMTFLPVSLLINPKISWKGRTFGKH